MEGLANSSATIPRRYLILGTGRNGSSLLSAILAASGANFGVPQADDWNPRTGAYELHEVGCACEAYRRSEHLREASYLSRVAMWRRKWHRAHAKRLLRRCLAQAEWLKSGYYLLPILTRQLGYQPVIILLYRHYREQLASAHLRHGFGLAELAETYTDINESCLLSLGIFGGTVVSYADLADPHSQRWAEAIGELTGLAPATILARRAAIVKPRPASDATPLVEDPRLDALTRRLEAQRGVVLPASRLAERA